MGTWYAIEWSFLQRLTRGIRSSVGILALPFRPLYNNMSLLYPLRFLRDSHFKYSRMPVMPPVSVIVSCYKPSRSILNLFELILKTFTWGVPNRTTIFQDWAHQSFICCLFYLLWTKVKILSQETKGPISLSANIADMCIPSQIICDSDPKILDAFDIFEDRSL